MTKLDPTFINRVRRFLGYPIHSTNYAQEFNREYDEQNILYLEIILEQLEEIDRGLELARSESMAEKVGEINLNYAKHIIHLKEEGRRLLNELSQSMDVPIEFNKYLNAFNRHSRVHTNYW